MDPLCLILAPLLAIVVSGLKKLPIVKRYPKVAAALLAPVLAVAVQVWRTSHPEAAGFDWSTVMTCAAEYFAGAVATHEVISHGTKAPRRDRTA